MLDRLLGSTARAAILRLLFGDPEAELHLREIQRRTGLAVRSVTVQLDLLRDLGLIREQRRGQQRYLRADPDHPAFAALRELVRVTAGIGDVIAAAIADDPRITLAVLFGSVARGAETSESDVDLLVVGDLPLRDLLALLAPAQEQVRRPINPVLMTPAEFAERRSRGEHFVTRVLNSEHVILLERPHEHA